MRKAELEKGNRGNSAVPVIKGQTDFLAEWRETGLITDAQLATFTRTCQPAAKGR
ncbi:hypothetical protein [Streptomyces graminilatus]|uniref:hypothetical protein n=1 Tax=Streptomyces graminilatus TaxID=1464070 RepID=UPI000AA84CB9|nr:hypothetical protein [Streptomyces graminilatus]